MTDRKRVYPSVVSSQPSLCAKQSAKASRVCGRNKKLDEDGRRCKKGVGTIASGAQGDQRRLQSVPPTSKIVDFFT